MLGGLLGGLLGELLGEDRGQITSTRVLPTEPGQGPKVEISFESNGTILGGVLAGNEHVGHRYVVRDPNRGAVLAELEGAAIGAAVHYSVPIHLPAGEMLGHRRGDFPHAGTAAAEILSLPIYPGIRADQGYPA